MIAPLARLWRWIFFVEMPLVMITLALWLFQPATYLRDTIGITTPGESELFLLRLYAGTVASMILLFYGWFLLQPVVHLPTFRTYQVCLGIGDVFIILASLVYGTNSQQNTLLIAQMGMALFWGVLRVVFLFSTRANSH